MPFVIDSERHYRSEKNQWRICKALWHRCTCLSARSNDPPSSRKLRLVSHCVRWRSLRPPRLPASFLGTQAASPESFKEQTPSAPLLFPAFLPLSPLHTAPLR